MSDEIVEGLDAGLTIAEIKAKYEDPRFDLLRDETYMTDQHLAIQEMYLIDVIVNAVTTASREVIEEHYPKPLPPLSFDLLMDMLRSDEYIRYVVERGLT